VRRESTVKPKRARKERSSAGRRGALAEERRAKEGRGAERREAGIGEEGEGEGRRRARQSAKKRGAPLLCCEGGMGEPERREALLFFSLFFAQIKDPKAREIIFEGAHREGAKEQREGLP
jgi:hypothetical protein